MWQNTVFAAAWAIVWLGESRGCTIHIKW